jgi:regulatory protein YycI of two-component signal transduction system YycFG
MAKNMAETIRVLRRVVVFILCFFILKIVIDRIFIHEKQSSGKAKSGFYSNGRIEILKQM